MFPRYPGETNVSCATLDDDQPGACNTKFLKHLAMITRRACAVRMTSHLHTEPLAEPRRRDEHPRAKGGVDLGPEQFEL